MAVFRRWSASLAAYLAKDGRTSGILSVLEDVDWDSRFGENPFGIAGELL